MKHNEAVIRGDRSCSIPIGSGILDSFGESCKAVGPKGKRRIVIGEKVVPLYMRPSIFIKLEYR